MICAITRLLMTIKTLLPSGYQVKNKHLIVEFSTKILALVLSYLLKAELLTSLNIRIADVNNPIT